MKKDFFEAYRKSAAKKNVAIVASAFLLAVSVNAVIFGTDAGVRLQTSAVQYAVGTKSVEDSAADIAPVSAGTGTDLVKLRFGREAKAVKEIRATIVSDAQALSVKDVFTTDRDAEITKVSNVEGMTLVNVRYATPKDLPAGTEIATVAYSKSGSEPVVLNLVETAFVSGNETYELSSSAIEL